MREEKSLRTNKMINRAGSSPMNRIMPIGAEILKSGGVHFRVWAPESQIVSVALDTGKTVVNFQLQPDQAGYFSGLSLAANEGMCYQFKLNNDFELYADPASRFQPRGPLGPSEIIDSNKFAWSDNNWPGINLKGQVIYEMHIGTFTQEGTWQSAMPLLRELADLGITLLEVMPVADFAGDYGWGYDGVNLFAPTRLYGRPNDMKSFVNEAHAQGLGVILDIVYNHIGPVGNVLSKFSSSYFTSKYKNDWGEAINFDGPDSAPVREYFISNAKYWIREYHLDGFRVDATQTIFDQSKINILTEISQHAREAAGKRNILLTAENEPQDSRIVRPIDEGGYGFDAVWNDDFHHSAIVALTGHSKAYYSDYRGKPQEMISAVKRGYLFQGQWHTWQKQRRGWPAIDIKPPAFINYIQNHDQIANSLRGERINFLTSPGRYRAMTALMLLAPGTPMLFQGQEFGSSAPFLYFGNISPELFETVSKGREEFLHQFCNLTKINLSELMPKPDDIKSVHRSKLNHQEKLRNMACYTLHRDLLRLRKTDPAFTRQCTGGIDGAVLGENSFVLRFFGEEEIEDRLLVMNLGADQDYSPLPEPLLAPPREMHWQILWSSENPVYGGSGTALLDVPWKLHLPGEAAIVLHPSRIEQEPC